MISNSHLLLKELTNSISPLPDSDWDLFSSIWKPFDAKRKEIITSAGEVEKFLYFVVEGVQRVFYLDDQQREATIVFTYAPSFGGVLDSFLLQNQSNYFYETLTPSVFLRTTSIEVKKLMDENPAIQKLVQHGV